MEATPSKPPFTTTNLVLASVLALEGYGYRMLVLDRESGVADHPQGAWQFDNDPGLDEIVDRFKSEDYLVEPEAFQRKLNEVRRKLLDFLGVN